MTENHSDQTHKSRTLNVEKLGTFCHYCYTQEKLLDEEFVRFIFPNIIWVSISFFSWSNKWKNASKWFVWAEDYLPLKTE